MRLGPLQKYILLVSRSSRNPVFREKFIAYYQGKKKKPSREDQVNAITKAIEKMINANLVVAEGVKTSEKFFIKMIRLTPRGRSQVKKIIGSQQRLPINKR